MIRILVCLNPNIDFFCDFRSSRITKIFVIISIISYFYQYTQSVEKKSSKGFVSFRFFSISLMPLMVIHLSLVNPRYAYTVLPRWQITYAQVYNQYLLYYELFISKVSFSNEKRVVKFQDQVQGLWYRYRSPMTRDGKTKCELIKSIYAREEGQINATTHEKSKTSLAVEFRLLRKLDVMLRDNFLLIFFGLTSRSRQASQRSGVRYYVGNSCYFYCDILAWLQRRAENYKGPTGSDRHGVKCKKPLKAASSQNKFLQRRKG